MYSLETGGKGGAEKYYWQLKEVASNANYDFFVCEFDEIVKNILLGILEKGFKGRFAYAWEYFFNFAAIEQVAVFGSDKVNNCIVGYEMVGMWLDWYYGGHKNGEPLLFENYLAAIHDEVKIYLKNSSVETTNRALYGRIEEYYKSLHGYWTEYLITLNPFKQGYFLIKEIHIDELLYEVALKALNEIGFNPEFFQHGFVPYPVMKWETEDYGLWREG